MTLRQLHKKAKDEHWAIPHFNIASFVQLKAIVIGAQKSRAPVLIGASEGEREFLGLKETVAMVAGMREEYDIPIFLNADHSKSPDSAIKAFEAGFDSVHIDLSKEAYDKNIEGTKEVVDYVRGKNSEVQVEAELGYLATDSSKVYHNEVEIPEDSYTKVDQAVEFVEKTGIDRFAPAIGNLHGIAANKPKIRFDLIEKLNKALPQDLTFTLHGGSGIGDEDMKKIVEMGFNNVHISTEIRVAFAENLRKALNDNTEETAPYKYFAPPIDAVAALVEKKLAIYNTVNVV